MDLGVNILDEWPRAWTRAGRLYAFALSEWFRACRFNEETRAPSLNDVLRRLGVPEVDDRIEPLDMEILPA